MTLEIVDLLIGVVIGIISSVAGTYVVRLIDKLAHKKDHHLTK